MKFTISTYLCIFVLIILDACTFSTSFENDNSTSTSSIKSTPISDSLTYTIKNISLNYEKSQVNLTYPIFQNSTLNQLLITYFCKDFEGKNESSFEVHASEILNNFKKFILDFPDRKEMGVALYSNEKINCQINLQNWLCISYEVANYYGGAHGNQYKTFLNFNPQTNETITLNNIINDIDYQNIKKESREIFFKLKNIKNESDLKENFFFENGEFYLPENFYISKEGLNFYYNTYDIQAYVYGPTLLQIPIEILEKTLKPNHILIQTIHQIH